MAERGGFEDFSKSGNVENQGRSDVPHPVYPQVYPKSFERSLRLRHRRYSHSSSAHMGSNLNALLMSLEKEATTHQLFI